MKFTPLFFLTFCFFWKSWFSSGAAVAVCDTGARSAAAAEPPESTRVGLFASGKVPGAVNRYGCKRARALHCAGTCNGEQG
jgi:hypothetical protein